MVVVAAATALLPAPVRAQGASQVLERAERHYDRSEFDEVIRQVTPLLYPRIRLSTEDQALRAFRILGLSHLFEKNRDEAEKQFLAILAQRPDYRLDPLVDPVAAVEFFEDVKRRNAERIREIRLREEKMRREQERKRLERERREEAEVERRRAEAERRRRAARRVVVRHPYWINFVPFGAGQFQNGHRTKGFVVMGLQLGLGALSAGTALGLRVAYPDGTVPAHEWDRARALSVTQVAAGALFFAAVIYGVADALYHHEPQHVELRTADSDKKSKKKSNDSKSSLQFTPALGPGGVGIGLGVTF